MHSCERCGNTFTRKSNLKRHESSNRCQSSVKNSATAFSPNAIADHNRETLSMLGSGKGEREQYDDCGFNLTYYTGCR